jgi:hypothetical protein
MLTVLEQGNIAIAFRPKVDVDSVQSFDDVQRLFIVLQPDMWKYRLIVIGRKKLPEPGPNQRFWGVVDKVTEDPSAIQQEFEPYEYETKTRGRRLQKAVRLAASGNYAIYRHDDHTHLNFNVERKGAEFGLHLPDYGEYILTAKNLDMPDRFDTSGRVFKTVRSTELLDLEGTQIVLIATNHGAQALSRLA